MKEARVKLTTAQWIAANREKLLAMGDQNQRIAAIQGACGGTRDNCVRKLAVVLGVKTVWKHAEHMLRPRGLQIPPTPPPKGKSLEHFRAEHDIALRIARGIERHLNGVYMTEQEFREACGINTTLFARYRDDFDQNRLRIGDKWFWAKPEMIAEMKQIAGIA